MLDFILKISIFFYIAWGLFLVVETGRSHYYKRSLEVYIMISVLFALYWYVSYFKPLGAEYT